MIEHICRGCDAPCVPGSVPANRVPEGHRRYKARGLCKSCYRSAQHKAVGRPERKIATVACTRCGIEREVRPDRNNSDLCGECKIAARCCKECDRPMTTQTTPASEMPDDHVRHGAKGLCSGCYARHRRGGGKMRATSVPCVRCGEPRYVKNKRPQSTGLCKACFNTPADEDESDVELTGGRWVAKRGILRWESDGTALPTSRAQRGTSRVQHGTDSGYHSHRRQTHGWPKEACQPCKQAHAAKQSETARVKREEAAA